MFFDDEDMNFNLNIPDDTPPDGMTDCSEFNEMLTALVELVANLDQTDALASISLLQSVPALLYKDGPSFNQEKALGILIGQTFIVTLIIDSFDEDSQSQFFNSLEAGLLATEESQDELEDVEIIKIDHFATEDLIRIFRECNFDDVTSRQLLMMKITNFAANEDSSINEIVHAQLMLQLNVTILSLLAGMDDEDRNDMIRHLRETSKEIATEDWVPFYNLPDDDEQSAEIAFDQLEPVNGAQRVTFSMCFDVATQEEAIAQFVCSAANILKPGNLDAILKVETFDEPLAYPYANEQPRAIGFFDVEEHKAFLQMVFDQVHTDDRKQKD
jgi:hypothetical protein